jgi:MFS family permease
MRNFILTLVAMRVCLSFAIQLMSKEFNWESSVQGYALSSFFMGYIVTQVRNEVLKYLRRQVPGGILASKYGGKWVLGLGILSASVLSILTPSVVTAGGIGPLIVVRILVTTFRISSDFIRKVLVKVLHFLQCTHFSVFGLLFPNGKSSFPIPLIMNQISND